ncbi:MAG: hypothetical protein L0Y56_15660, partial [Nitrospira sp.]|nr:hypothetical protein [Nitrospira sp.]
YAYNNPLKYTDPDGYCPAPPPGLGSGRVICVAGFIPTATSQALGVQFTGDDRDFNPYGTTDESSRFWVWIDTQTGEILDYGYHKTCIVGEADCAGPREADCGAFNNCLESSRADDGTIELEYRAICDGSGPATDGQCAMTANGSVSFMPAEEGGFDVYAVVDDFPNLEGYYYVDGELAQELFQLQNFSEEEIASGVASPLTAAEMLAIAPSSFYWIWADPLYTYEAAKSGGAR